MRDPLAVEVEPIWREKRRAIEARAYYDRHHLGAWLGIRLALIALGTLAACGLVALVATWLGGGRP